MSKFIQLTYNGETGWTSNIGQVLEFFKINQDVNEWLDVENDEGISNRQLIFEAYDDKTKFRAGFIDKDGEPGDKDADDINQVYPCPWPLIVHVESSNLQRDILVNQTNVVAPIDRVNNFRLKNQKEPDNIPDENFAFSATLGSRSEFSFWDILGTYTDTDGSLQRKTAERWVKQGSTGGDNDQYNMTQKEAPKLVVWIWCKSLMGDKGFNPTSVFDLTPFIQQMSLNQTEAGGQFNLTLAPVIGDIACEIGEDGYGTGSGSWFVSNAHYHAYFEKKIKNYAFKTQTTRDLNETERIKWAEEVNAQQNENQDKTYGKRAQANQYDGSVSLHDEYSTANDQITFLGKRSEFFFKNLVAENDVIFIGMDERRDIFDEGSWQPRPAIDDFFHSVEELQWKPNLMIGMVDTNTISFNAESSDVTIQVSGRDCMKLLVEDGTYFFQKSYSNPDNDESAFNNVDIPRQGDEVNTLNKVEALGSLGVNRLITSGLIETLYNTDARNVGYVMNLLMSRLCNIEVMPSKVFDSYGDRRTQFQVEIDEPIHNKDGVGSDNEEEGE